ncbi:nuclear transport factor 2 family protein [Laspinema olomoucense]|uniref:nuclear transport factor 2 family protein n=1 Tax=Laspinema olomoucense TaxID=3231600 RepID=UPI0021BA9009|nr:MULTISPECIES: nuclear transport factor 2 family protein [unclassified Laspinema]MCT7972093.1 nuclear transport factor 2 family protein [Laspinema sp. D3d]MCT7991493.1 nuclear transport factor 2 family protein [Laspinema sp. D3a]MCT7995001.1 nuclear transport factor 2 family protein [Laspinema sp. D3c]
MSAEPAVLEANLAFYRAFQTKNMEAMSEIWSKGINTLCIHPGRKILKGWEEIRPSWQKIFTATTTLEIELQITASESIGNLAYIVLIEKVTQTSNGRKNQSLSNATNLFENMGGKWYLIHHHGSPILR